MEDHNDWTSYTSHHQIAKLFAGYLRHDTAYNTYSTMAWSRTHELRIQSPWIPWWPRPRHDEEKTRSVEMWSEEFQTQWLSVFCHCQYYACIKSASIKPGELKSCGRISKERQDMAVLIYPLSKTSEWLRFSNITVAISYKSIAKACYHAHSGKSMNALYDWSMIWDN